MTRQTFFFLEYMDVVKCTASSTNWLTGYVSVDVLIKTNCINFIEKKCYVEKTLMIFEGSNPFSSSVENCWEDLPCVCCEQFTKCAFS